MAGMGDNPLIGDYTKGISKGPEYWRNLARRAEREEFPISRLKPDLQMGLFAQVKQNGQVRFGSNVAPKQRKPLVSEKLLGPKPAQKALPKKSALVRSFLDLKQLFPN